MTRAAKSDKTYWYYALVGGSALQLFLFILLPWLAPTRVVPDALTPIEVEFVTWQTPPAPSIVVKQEKPLKTQKPKTIPHPPKQLDIIKPTTTEKSVLPEPSLETTEQEVSNTPVTPLPPPQESVPENVTEQPPTDSAATQVTTLPTPLPEYLISEYPSYAHEAPGIYPFEMRSQGREAVVGLDVLIDKDGTVRNITITHSQGVLFDQAAVDKIRRSSFLPGKSDGVPVVVLLHEKVAFKLR